MSRTIHVTNCSGTFVTYVNCRSSPCFHGIMPSCKPRKDPSMNINHAILHVLDFVSCENTFSAEEIDLSDKTAKNYVSRLAGKALNDLDAKLG